MLMRLQWEVRSVIRYVDIQPDCCAPWCDKACAHHIGYTAAGVMHSFHRALTICVCVCVCVCVYVWLLLPVTLTGVSCSSTVRLGGFSCLF